MSSGRDFFDNLAFLYRRQGSGFYFRVIQTIYTYMTR